MANVGLASVGQVASALGVAEGVVREWARSNGVERVGSVFAFQREDVVGLVDDVEEDEEEVLGALGFDVEDENREDTDDVDEEDDDDLDDDDEDLDVP